MQIYLSGAMASVSKEQGNGWRETVKEHMRHYPVHVINPYEGNPKNPYDPTLAEKIVERDKRLIFYSDLVILNTGHSAVGSPMECIFAWQHRKPIWEFGGSVNPWYSYHVTKRFKTLGLLLLTLEIKLIGDCKLANPRY